MGSKAGHGRRTPCEVASAGLDACDLSFDGEFTFTSWAASLTRLVLKSGTRFAHFLASSLHLFRSDVPSAPTALYPIPSPSALPVGRRARKRGGTRRANPHISPRALHVIILALNFVHAGFKPVPLDLLRRSPNSLHISVYRRVSGYLRACCRRGVSMPFCAGRRGTHLAARFGELTDFLLACGVGPDAYDGAVHEAVLKRPLVPHAPGGPECLRPYRPLEADGIVLHGEANWDISPYLPPGMLLAYRDPLVLETFPGSGGPSPSFQHEDPGEVLKLMKVWDSKGLLSLRPGGLPDIRCSRVFGAYKGPGKFRQIGDRRGPNSLEARLDGVSHLLPQGFLLTRLHVPRFTHQLLGSSTDRKDFYSQCKVPLERAFSNAVKPGFSLGDFANTRAHRAYVEWVLSEAGKEHCRRYLPPGDFSSVAVRRSALLCPTAPVHGCFNSLFQGDAAGVELATAAHAAFLEEALVLPAWEGGRVLAKHPVHPTGPWSGVVIDDLFCISCEPADLPDHQACDSARVIGLAKEAYAGAGIRGSDDKDVWGASVFCIAGAECDSSPAAVKEGLVTIGSPLSKRLALSLVSLLTATRRCVTEELASMITGGWTSTLMFRRCAMAVASSIFEQRVDKTTGDEGSPLVALGPSSRQELVLLAVLAPLLASCVSVPYDRRLFASDASLRKGAFTYMRPDPEVAKAVWLSSDARGFYTKLEGPFRATLAALGEEPAAGDAPAPPLCSTAASAEPPDVFQFDKGWGPGENRPKITRPLGQRFDFLLVGPGPASLVNQLKEAGLCCGPILDASTSRHFRLDCPDAVEWAMHLLAQGRIGSLPLFLPCGALSTLALGLPSRRVARYPARVHKGLVQPASRCFGWHGEFRHLAFWCSRGFPSLPPLLASDSFAACLGSPECAAPPALAITVARDPCFWLPLA